MAIDIIAVQFFLRYIIEPKSEINPTGILDSETITCFLMEKTESSYKRNWEKYIPVDSPIYHLRHWMSPANEVLSSIAYDKGMSFVRLGNLPYIARRLKDVLEAIDMHQKDNPFNMLNIVDSLVQFDKQSKATEEELAVAKDKLERIMSLVNLLHNNPKRQDLVAGTCQEIRDIYYGQ